MDAGFGSVTSTASAWCFAEADDLAWWSTTWAERLVSSPFGHQVEQLGLASRDELAALAGAWREWAAAPGAWFAILHGEVICRPTSPADSDGFVVTEMLGKLSPGL